MLRTRVMPCLLLRNGGLVKTIKFKNPKYVGDAINIVRIFNEKEVDELIFLDIMASKNKSEPMYDVVAEIATECFMPFTYGGGIATLQQAEKLFKLGVEKVAINTAGLLDLRLIEQITKKFGSQSVVVAIDVKKDWLGRYHVYVHSKKKCLKIAPILAAQAAEQAGAGEILLTSVDQDGIMSGYDLTLIEQVAEAVTVPVVACGGAGKVDDFAKAVDAGAAGVAAGSMMVYQGDNRAVLTRFPKPAELEKVLGKVNG